jgi:hypothetical protein
MCPERRQATAVDRDRAWSRQHALEVARAAQDEDARLTPDYGVVSSAGIGASVAATDIFDTIVFTAGGRFRVVSAAEEMLALSAGAFVTAHKLTAVRVAVCSQ